LLERGRELEGALLEALTPLGAHEPVAEVRGGVGLLAAVELTGEVLERRPDAVAVVARHARERGVLVRPLGRGVAVSPPLTIDEQHFGLIAEAIDGGLVALAE
jgi:adenosylmethionine-8-amino-7-oxononanoate aminotransferase